jgi:hypothetical protein
MSENIKLGTYDALTVLKDAGAITASAAGTVDDVAKVIDLGAARMDAKAIVHVTAAGTGTGEKQVINIQVSDDEFDADIYNVGVLELGDAAQLVGDTDVGVGTYEIPFNNVINGTVKRYCRVYATITAVSPATSLNYSAHLVS